jgi:branched-chain amino acid transport system substrate-binding protein
MAQKHAKNFGVEMVYSAQASFAKPDYTAECLNAKNAGAQAFMVGFDGNGVSRVAAACARQGYHPVYFVGSVPAVQHLTDKNIKQLVVSTPVAPFGSSPTQEMAEAFKRYLPDVTVLVGHVEGWTAGKMLERAARSFTADPVTADALLQGLWTVKNEDLGGLSGPQTFNRDAPVTPTTCWFLIERKDGKFAPYNGGKRECTDIKP